MFIIESDGRLVTAVEAASLVRDRGGKYLVFLSLEALISVFGDVLRFYVKLTCHGNCKCCTTHAYLMPSETLEQRWSVSYFNPN